MSTPAPACAASSWQRCPQLAAQSASLPPAGRMQDNEPLMRALSNLISLNEPDLTLFVGEALVGNDAVDQLTKFNQRLADLARTPNAQMIQGLVLTKMDTIDDKVCVCTVALPTVPLALRAFMATKVRASLQALHLMLACRGQAPTDEQHSAGVLM